MEVKSERVNEVYALTFTGILFTFLIHIPRMLSANPLSLWRGSGIKANRAVVLISRA